MKEEFNPKDAIKTSKELMDGILEYSNKLENDNKQKSVALDKKPELIEHKSVVLEAINESELSKDELAVLMEVEVLIENCGDGKEDTIDNIKKKLKTNTRLLGNVENKLKEVIKDTDSKYKTGAKNKTEKELAGEKLVELNAIKELLVFLKSTIK